MIKNEGFTPAQIIGKFFAMGNGRFIYAARHFFRKRKTRQWRQLAKFQAAHRNRQLNILLYEHEDVTMRE